MSFAPFDVDIGFGCTLSVDPTVLLFTGVAVTDATGTGKVPLPISSDPNLAGLQLFAQHLVLDPDGAFQDQLAFTEGLKILQAVR